MAITKITVRGARQHNLKNIDVEIPRNTLTVVTGLSGSGKSSLAFDTIYAEGQRRYVETLSTYARQFLDQMERPDVDAIDGLSPAISIEQKTTSRSPRSTVGTITEIYDYLRLLFASIGIPHCPKCGRPISRQSAEQIVQRVMALTPEDRVMVLAPIVRGRKGEFKKEMETLLKHGYTRARVDGEIVNLDDDLNLDKRKNHTIEVVIDRLLVKPGIEHRLEMSVGLAMKLAGGLVQVAVVGGEETLYSEKLACPDCGISVPQLEPRSLSFNSMYGACPECHGLGSRYDFDPAKVITDWSKPLLDGGLGPGSASQGLIHALQVTAAAHGIDLATPFEKFPERIQDLLLNGESGRGKTGFRGIFGYLKQNLAGKHGRKSKRHVDRRIHRAANFKGARCCPQHQASGPRRKDCRPRHARSRRAPAISERRRTQLHFSRPLGGDSFRRRRPAHPSGHADWLKAARCALRARRAFHRTASSRQRTLADRARKPARPGQYRAGGGA